MNEFDVIVLGGGAGGYFSAISCAEANPKLKVVILEGTRRSLTKVQISGGGRCNVTHNCLDPHKLVEYYPRGFKELRQVFARFHVQHTLEWFQKRGVELKAEADGRMFSVTNRSQTIIDCLQKAALDAGVEVRYGQIVTRCEKQDEGGFVLTTQQQTKYVCRQLLLATGSAPGGHEVARSIGLKIIDPVPSLFTFQVEDPSIHERSGLSMQDVALTLSFSEGKKKFFQRGPLLFTHWGLSGPCVLKLSAWAARELYESKYQARLCINWLPELDEAKIKAVLFSQRKSKKTVGGECPFSFPRKLWEWLLQGLDAECPWASLSAAMEKQLLEKLLRTQVSITGKGVFKEEFVSCGGVDLKEINFTSMECRKVPGCYVVGELLNIDGITGGFNFQNAWSTGWIAGQHIGSWRASSKIHRFDKIGREPRVFSKKKGGGQEGGTPS